MRVSLIVALAFALVSAACGDDLKSKSRKVNPNATANNTSANNGSGNVSTANNTATNNTATNNGGALCGNGVLDAAETCDPAIAEGTGACVSGCSSRACTTATIVGSPAQCDAACVVEPVGCIDDDGCCTEGCSAANDSDCDSNEPVCQNGVVEAGELCDGNCPTSCPAGPSACQPNVLSGSAASCDAQCIATTVTTCSGGDGCCPSGCTSANDSDCTSNCTPDTCANLGASCGNPPDGCGGSLSCGACGIGSCTTDYLCSSVGDACMSNSDCVAGTLAGECLTSEPMGYCTASCQTTADACPGDSFCEGGSIFDPTGVCNAPCTSDNDCRASYECRELVAGTASSRTCLPIE